MILESIEDIRNNLHDYKILNCPYKGSRSKRKGKYRIIFIISEESETIKILKYR
jgi:mRNA-degrading endonuclease RelE of RelBE toxin-antitoxin system